MKSLTITLCLLTFFRLSLSAQESIYFNEWIDYSKTYHKFRIAEDGLYHIPYSALQQAGLAEKNPEGFHLFSRGKEVPIFVSSDEVFGSDDFIEFYGQKNDGSFDTQLFQNPDWQLTDRQSLFTDSIGYYLMWDDSFEGERIEVVENDLSGELPEEEAYFMYESGRIFKQVFSQGTPTRVHSMERPDGVHVHFADFEVGEGFVSQIILGETTKTYKIPTLGVYRASNTPMAILQTKMVSQYGNLEEDLHHLKLHINETTYLDETYGEQNTPIFEVDIPTNELSEIRTDIDYESVGDLFENSSEDWQSIAYTFLTYPRQFDFSVYANGEVKNGTEFYFELQHFNEVYFEVSSFNGGNQTVLYDLNNNWRMEIVAADTLYKIHLPESASIQGDSRKLFLANTDEGVIRTVDSLQSIKFTNYQQLANQGNYLIISHPSLRKGEIDWVQSYSNYRSTSNGGSHSVVLADIEELYDQFAHGILKHPLAIRHFVNFAMDRWGMNPEYLFLVGKGISYRVTTTTTNFNDNLIPTFGHQPSDIMLATRSISDYRPQLGVGRLSARTSDDVKNYFHKIQQYENIDFEDCTIADRAWRKQALFQSSSNVDMEIPMFEAYLEDYEDVLERVNFGGKVLDVQANKAYSSNFHTAPFIEQGIGILQYSGHGTAQSWKTDILENPISYNQDRPRFPVIFSAASFAGHIFKATNSKKSLAEFWVSSENKGAIGFLAEVSFDWRESEDMYLTELYRQFSLNNYNQPIGKCLKETIQNVFIGNPNDELYDMMKTNVQTFVFEGDPALIIGGGFDRPEYIVDNDYHYSFIDKENGYVRTTEKRNDVWVLDVDGNVLESQNGIIEVADNEGNLQLKVRVTNLGKAIEEDFTIRVSRRIVGETELEMIAEKSVASPFYEKVYTLDLPYLEETTEEGSIYEYFVEVDADNDIEEDCEDNNEVVLPLRFSTCASVATQYENLEIIDLQSDYCISDSAIQLQANIVGGTFAIEQIGGPTYHVNVFQPSQLGGGDFLIHYTITDAGTGCVFAIERLVSIIHPIAAIESIDLTEVCVGDAIQINALPTEGEYVWDFDGGNFDGTPQNPTISWDSTGEKYITLKVLEDGCESVMIVQLVTVYPQVAENFPIVCNATGSSVTFNWEAEGATGFQLYWDDVLIQNLPPDENSFTFANLEPEQEVSIKVVAIAGGTCEEVEATITCKTACSGEVPILEVEDTYCGSNPMIIAAPVVNGVFHVTLQNGTSFEVFNNLSTAILPDGLHTIVFEYTTNGCTYTSFDYQVIVSNPVVEIEVNSNQSEEIATLSVVGDFEEYLWNTGETSPTIEVTANGTYSVITTDEYGCTSMASVEVVITDIERIDRDLAIEVYPNPFRDELVIEGKALKGSWLQLYDIQGQLMISKRIENEAEILDLKDLSEGVYLLKVVGEQSFWSEKVVKK